MGHVGELDPGGLHELFFKVKRLCRCNRTPPIFAALKEPGNGVGAGAGGTGVARPFIKGDVVEGGGVGDHAVQPALQADLTVLCGLCAGDSQSGVVVVLNHFG